VVVLKGLTWDHPRGRAGLEATAKVYHESHPNVEVRWEVRTLHEFGDQPLDHVARRYDMLIIDHPFSGLIADTECMVPLDAVLPKHFLSEQKRQSAGPSFRSYTYAGHQWALAIDAATQVSAYRPDLLRRPPQTWRQVSRMMRRGKPGSRMVLTPLGPVNAISCFLSLCANLGAPPFDGKVAVEAKVGRAVLRVLDTLARRGHPDSLTMDPPAALDLMSETDEVCYIPLLYGYSNYSRPSQRRSLVKFMDIPSAGRGPIGSNLGGAGLAVSSESRHVEECADYAMYVSDAETQRGVYFEAGGQPGNRVAWRDASVNSRCSNFFRDTWTTIQHSYLRPRYNGYVGLQIKAGEIVHSFLSDHGDPNDVLDRLQGEYRASLADTQ
jgi:multiple sugar transport system substrate-binding protein